MTNLLHRSSHHTPPLAVSASRAWITDSTGKRYLDASGGAAVSCIGHAVPRVTEAITRQASAMEYAHNSFFTSAPAEELATLLIDRSKGHFEKVYFVNDGSEAVEAAVKMARQHFVEKGEPQRRHIVSRRQSYHGNTLGALAIGGNVARRSAYNPLLMQTHQVSACFEYRGRNTGETPEAYADRLAGELEEAIQHLGEDSVIAFVAETVVGATAGAVVPVNGYFTRIREICDRYGILLILDEVMCGSGRTGSFHAFEQEGIAPDILTNAKGLGGGFLPIGAVYANKGVLDPIATGSGSFKHGHTYNAHPIACAAALEVQTIIGEDGLVGRAAAMGEKLGSRLRARFADHPHVGDIRGRGLLQAIELVTDREARAPFPAELAIAAGIKTACMELGLCVYPGTGTADGEHGDHVLLAPPYTITEDELDLIVERLGAAVDKVTLRTLTP